MTATRPEGRWRAGIVLGATLAGMALTGALGAWQLDRAAQKHALQAALEERGRLPALEVAQLAATPEAARAQQHRGVHLRGRWLPEATVFLDNRQMHGRPGFYVLTPLQLAGRGEAVLVQRGWVPRDAQERSRLPSLPLPAGEVELAGRIAAPPARLYEFGAAGSGPIRQNLDLQAHARELRRELLPLSVLQLEGPAGDGLLRDWPRPALDVHKHYGYALQWFGLCALMAGLYLWFRLLRPRLRHVPST